MTHDELMANIKTGYEFAGIKYAPDAHTFALRAVVELHKTFDYKNYLEQELKFCSECTGVNGEDYWVEYPCPTIQVITEQLR